MIFEVMLWIYIKKHALCIFLILILIILQRTLALPGKGPLKAGGYMGNRRDSDSVPVLLRKHHQGCPFLCHAWLFPLAASLILHLLSILACCGFLTTLLGNERHSLYFFGLRVFLFERLPPPTEITIRVLAWPFQKQTHANFCLVNNSDLVCEIWIQKRYFFFLSKLHILNQIYQQCKYIFVHVWRQFW